ncbi:MAG: TatD family nuclease-associated radical SAM protein [Oscillospiraceae bacterium]|nr:TatD family nuclease-associated radical SAM protein [Oscillospiraceae bacterium]
MPQNITYTVGGGLYINMTNRCTCDCDFCLRNKISAVGESESLWLDCEPSREEVLESVVSRVLSGFDEVVFCGFGEPMIRFDDLFWVARQIKQIMPSMPIRVNTNGHANMIAGCDITPQMANIIDRLSVSLNRSDAEAYNLHVRSVFGARAFDGMLDFVKRAKNYAEITLTVVDVLLPDELENCRKIAEDMGVGFRVRAAY